jgi:hypothetical protein
MHFWLAPDHNCASGNEEGLAQTNDKLIYYHHVFIFCAGKPTSDLTNPTAPKQQHLSSKCI